MLMFMKVTDFDYLDMIYDGSYVRTKIVHVVVVEGITIFQHYAIKDKNNWITAEKNEVMKDAKNILHNSHNSLDAGMSNGSLHVRRARRLEGSLSRNMRIQEK